MIPEDLVGKMICFDAGEGDWRGGTFAKIARVVMFRDEQWFITSDMARCMNGEVHVYRKKERMIPCSIMECQNFQVFESVKDVDDACFLKLIQEPGFVDNGIAAASQCLDEIDGEIKRRFHTSRARRFPMFREDNDK